ncbi:MAG: NAD(P)(+) transhydrogenase (Re/Si-specific) subunit beta, partial [bacterium]
MIAQSQGAALSLVIDAAYLVAATLFIVGLKRLSSPKTARSGNVLGATGMLIAVAVTLLDR